MRILALDLSVSCTGWAYRDTDSGLWSSGVQSFKGRRGDSPGVRWIEFRVWMYQILNTVENTDLIVYEQAFHRGGAATHAAHGLIAIVEEVAADRGIEITSRAVTAIKKHAIPGKKRNRCKEAMVREAMKRWPKMNIIDDNHADALWLLDLVVKDWS